MVLLRCNFFQDFILHLIKDTDSIEGQAAQIFFKVKTLLNNAFKRSGPKTKINHYDKEEVVSWLFSLPFHHVVIN